MKAKGFWNDPDGFTIEDLAVLASLGLYVFVGAKMAMAKDVSSNQVDFFTVLGYPIIAAIAKRAIERIGWPTLGRRGQMQTYQPTYTPEPYYQPEQASYTPRDEGGSEEKPLSVPQNKPTI
ncbi:MAG: hypothetical protein RDV00_03970 [Clostridia bacterium]|nr:hypothetical protein [Clostridia bacterium]